MFWVKKYSFLFVILLFAGTTHAITLNVVPEKLDQFVTSLTTQDEFAGSVLAVLNDKVILRKGYGLAKVDTPNTQETHFCIGSITKSFTAMLVLQLAQEGKLNLDDPVQKHIPEFQHKDVTIYHVLTMTSGLPRDFWTPFDITQCKKQICPWGFECLIDQDDNKCSLERSYTVPLLSKPGEVLEYSNLGYLLLTHLIEIMSKQSYEKCLQQQIFAPLHMYVSSVSSSKDDQALAHAVGKPTIFLKEGYGCCLDYKLVHGAATIVSTIDDVYKWACCLKQGTLLDAKHSTKMKQPLLSEIIDGIDIGYACGLVIDKSDLKRVVRHNGGMSCYTSHMAIHQYNNDNKDVLTIIVLANKGDADVVAEGLVKIFEGETPTLKILRETSERDIDTGYEGAYVEDGKPEFTLSIKVGPESTLWLHQNENHIRLLAGTKKDAFGSNMYNLTVNFERDEHGRVNGFSTSNATETLKYTKQS